MVKPKEDVGKRWLPESKRNLVLNRSGDWIIGDFIIPLEALEAFQRKFTASTASELERLEKHPKKLAQRVLDIAAGGRRSYEPRKPAAWDPDFLRFQQKEIGFLENGKKHQIVRYKVRNVVFSGEVPNIREWEFMKFSTPKLYAEDKNAFVFPEAIPYWSPEPTQRGWNDMVTRKLIYPVRKYGEWIYKFAPGVKLAECEYDGDLVYNEDRRLLGLSSGRKIDHRYL